MPHLQDFTIVPMRIVGKLKGTWAAIKADTLAIVAFQARLFAAMAIYQQLIFPAGLPKTTATYWMMMQVAMIPGFFTAWPVNAWVLEHHRLAAWAAAWQTISPR